MSKIGRNDPCPCGSGKKYKKCCFPQEEISQSAPCSAWTHAEKKHLIKSASQYPVDCCLINPDWREGGFARIVVTRRQENGNLILGVFLVDIFCLGVKNAFCNVDLTPKEINEELLIKCFMDGRPLEIGILYAKQIIFGAVDYARKLGFDPHPDFSLTRHVLGTKNITGHHDIQFGGPEGKPLYIAGPDDNPQTIVRKLSSRLGKDGYHFIMPVDMPNDL